MSVSLMALLGCAGPTATRESGDTGSESAPEIWCESPVNAISYAEIGIDWGLFDTTSTEANRKEHPPVALADLDGDGDDDILLADREAGLYFQENTDSGFQTRQVATTTELTTLALSDVDGDHDLDLLTGGKDGVPRLYLNDGNGGLSDESVLWGLGELGIHAAVRDAAFADYDLDGYPDLYLVTANDGRTDDASRLHRLFHNDGTRFVDTSSLLSAAGRSGLGWQAIWSDFNADGFPDLFVANAEQGQAGPSRLFRNEGGVSFTDLTETCDCGYTGSNMGGTAADFDGNGTLDLFLTNTGPSPLLLNDGEFGFTNAAVALGATVVPDQNWMSFGSAAFDHDNDGDLDLWVATGGLWEGGAGSQVLDQPDVLLDWQGTLFVDVAPDLGLADEGDGRGVSYGMLNTDGFPDVVVTNQGTPSKAYLAACTDNRAIVVELRQDSPNPFGIGARVSLTTSERVRVHEVGTKPGWAAANHPRAWFGIGDEDLVSLSVRWPDGGTTDVALPVGANRRVTVTRE